MRLEFILLSSIPEELESGPDERRCGIDSTGFAMSRGMAPDEVELRCTEGFIDRVPAPEAAVESDHQVSSRGV